MHLKFSFHMIHKHNSQTNQNHLNYFVWFDCFISIVSPVRRTKYVFMKININFINWIKFPGKKSIIHCLNEISLFKIPSQCNPWPCNYPLSTFLCLRPVRVPEALCFSRVCPPVRSGNLITAISTRTLGWIFTILATGVPHDKEMNWLDFGPDPLKVKGQWTWSKNWISFIYNFI